MKQGRVVQIQKTKGLSDLVSRVGGTQPKLHFQKIKDRDAAGIPQGEYKGKQLIDTKQYLSPSYNIMKKRWNWGSTPKELHRLINAMNLKYSKFHPNKGQPITSESETQAAGRLKDDSDPVFNHPKFYGSFAIEEGRASFNLEDPFMAFVYYCTTGSPATQGSKERRVSKFETNRVRYKEVRPDVDRQNKAEKIIKRLKVGTLLSAMAQDEPRLRTVSRAMALPTYSRSADVTGLLVHLSDELEAKQIARDRYEGKTAVNRFLELCEMSPELLSVVAEVSSGIMTGVIRTSSIGFNFQGKEYSGKGRAAINEFFLDGKNQPLYIQLKEAVADKEYK